MTGLTLAQKNEKIREHILDLLRRERDVTARQISYELSVYNVWLSPGKVANFMRSDELLQQFVETEFVRRRKWSGLVYTHVKNGHGPVCHRG